MLSSPVVPSTLPARIGSGRWASTTPDLTFLVDYLFRSGAAPPCFDEAGYNASDGVDVSDLTDMVDYLFGGGDPPAFCSW